MALFARATILIVDDDPTGLQVTELILNRSGYNVLAASDGEAALKAFKEAQCTIQLVISDVVMPGMTGPELIRSIKRQSPSAATLLMSATLAIAADPRVASIVKPFTRAALVAKVQDLLAACDFARIEREQSIARFARLSAMSAI
jgi:two-component system cell cycle sensor histidine kinase/response regulator CckA